MNKTPCELSDLDLEPIASGKDGALISISPGFGGLFGPPVFGPPIFGPVFGPIGFRGFWF